MHVTLIVLAALWGAVTGLLVPRAAYRLSVPPGEPWRAHCPAGHAFAGPGRGWLAGPGRAACATAPAPLLAPLVSAAACVLPAAAGGPRPELAVWLLAVPVGTLLAWVDVRVRRLPDGLTLPLALAVPLLLGAAALLPGAAGSWTGALLGWLVLGGGYLLLHLISPRELGFGDVKLALPLGAALGWYGWEVLLAGAFLGFLLGAAYGFGRVLLGRASRSSAIPFGPFMLTGALLGLVLGAAAAPA